MIRYIYW